MRSTISDIDIDMLIREQREQTPQGLGSAYSKRLPQVATYQESYLPKLTDLSILPSSGVFIGRRLFDARYYLGHFADGAEVGADPAAHFISIGWRKGLNPHPLFDVGYYLSQCPELDTGAKDPLSHFVAVGASRGLRPHPLFDTAFYVRDHFDDVKMENPLVYFLEQGAALGHDPNPFFSTRFYQEVNPDVTAAGINPLMHYVTSGYREGRPVSPGFDGPFYAKRRGLDAEQDPLRDLVERLRAARSQFNLAPATPQISVVILNHGKSILTTQCVLDVLGDSSVEGIVEIVVVDNGSSAEEFARLALNLPPAIRVVRLGVNRFFGEGNNIGAEASRGQYVLFLNNDAFVSNGTIGALRSAFDRCGDCGAAGPRFVYPDGRIQEAGATVSSDGIVTQRGKLLENLAGRFDKFESVPYISAACLMLPRDLFDALGGFDLAWEPAYYEDVDLCLKVATAGKHVYYCPDAVVHHIENATSMETTFGFRLENIVAINREKFISRWGTYLDGRAPARVNVGHVVSDPVAATGKSAILHTPYALYPGGGERYLLTMAGALSAAFDVSLSTPERYSRLRLRGMSRELGLESSNIGYVPERGLEMLAKCDLLIAMGNHVLPPLPALGKQNVYLCQFPFPMSPRYMTDNWDHLKGYERIVVYSAFVARHLKARAEELSVPLPEIVIVPPPVHQMGAGAASKDGVPRILNVGRFRPGSHCKRQDTLIDAFKKLRKTLPDAELHLAGPLPPEPEAREYLVYLRDLARDEPVHFHLNAPFDDLRDLYGAASAYWHATGAGIPPDLVPECQEHFGIAILEAMSAGAVPFVLGEGGPPEFVSDGDNGFLWNTEAELVGMTTTFFSLDEQDRLALRRGAMQKAKEFDEAQFRSRVLVLFSH
jgi:GT2 family glycosyltransferase/glycosyltransferase involved in cell wall biosynthesis